MIMGSAVMIVVIASDDGLKIKLGHFGDAKYYLIYDISSNKPCLIKKVENPFREEEKHVHGVTGKRKKIVTFLRKFGDLKAVASTFFGPGGEEFFIKQGIRTFKFKPNTNVEEALKHIMEAFRKEKKDTSDTIS